MPHVLIENGVVITLDLTGNPPDGYVECPDDVQPGYLFDGETYTAPVIEPAVPEPYLNNSGLARFTGTSPVDVREAIRMSGVTRISKGRYRAYHAEAYPTDQYSAMPAVFDASPRTIRITARTTNYVEVRVTDLDGVVQDPAEVTVKTERVVTQ